MPIARWKALSEQAQAIWDTMEDGDKAVILAPHEERKKAFAPHNKPKPDSSKFSINTHMTQDIQPDSVDDVLNAMVTKHTNCTVPTSHPADIRSVLSQPVKTPKVQVKEEELIINGHKSVRKVQVHDIQHRVSQASSRKKGSLIDRGANGGVAGSDTRVIERHAHRTVDVRGIDNHEIITSIPIVTAGAVARSQPGDAILIMHQYAYHPQQGRLIHSPCQFESLANDGNGKLIHIPRETVNCYVSPLSI